MVFWRPQLLFLKSNNLIKKIAAKTNTLVMALVTTKQVLDSIKRQLSLQGQAMDPETVRSKFRNESSFLKKQNDLSQYCVLGKPFQSLL